MLTTRCIVWSLALAAAVGACQVSVRAQVPETAWKPVPGHIMTRWAKDVQAGAPLPEYPRPTMVRDRWMSLNGLWHFRVLGADGKDAALGSILVPFPIESALSGVKRALTPEETLRYSRKFFPPPDWAKSGRVLLHFGAVNWKSAVWVNGKKMGEHEGGYDPFSFDVTDALVEGDNEIVVEVSNPVNTGGQPRGKQWLRPHGIWYTPSSGIWQTVWLEPVPLVRMTGLAVRTERSAVDADRDPISVGRVFVDVSATANKGGDAPFYEIDIQGAGQRGTTTSQLGQAPVVVPKPRLWSPDDPYLYDLTVRMKIGGRVVDEVKSYFAFREIAVAKDSKGINRLMLNGKPLFQYGPLDQGFWPDGLYAAPTDAALKFDVEAVKRMGGNMLRKHVKVEPERFYHWCDKLGVMVWQDMPSAFFRSRGFDEGAPEISDKWKANFERELQAMIKARSSHPSIVMWVPFNEGWGQNDLDWCRGVAEKVKQWDPTRLVNNASGWTDMKVGDTMDVHAYPEPATPPTEEKRAAVLGEFGGLGLPIDGHTWVDKNNWGYVSYKSKEEVTEAYVKLLEQIPMLNAQGLCAAVYTQTTDVEIEVNGWLTYDREEWKLDADRAGVAARLLYLPPPEVRTVLADARSAEKRKWRYAVADPGEDWNKAEFDASSWPEGAAGFGSKGTPGAVIGTEWTGREIRLRSEFDLTSVPVSPRLAIHHDEDAEVYVNGVLAASLKGYTTSYKVVPMTREGAGALRVGKNVIAVHCRQTRGGQYVDCGVVDVVPGK